MNLGIRRETDHSKDSTGTPQHLTVAGLWRHESLTRAIDPQILTDTRDPVAVFRVNHQEAQRP